MIRGQSAEQKQSTRLEVQYTGLTVVMIWQCEGGRAEHKKAG